MKRRDIHIYETYTYIWTHTHIYIHKRVLLIHIHIHIHEILLLNGIFQYIHITNERDYYSHAATVRWPLIQYRRHCRFPLPPPASFFHYCPPANWLMLGCCIAIVWIHFSLMNTEQLLLLTASSPSCHNYAAQHTPRYYATPHHQTELMVCK